MRKPILLLSLFALSLWTMQACSGGKSKDSNAADKHDGTMHDDADHSASNAESMAISAVAMLDSKSGSKVTGTCTFTEKDGMVTLMAVIQGAEPGTHAIHIHEKGDCSADDGSSAGGHWNPSAEAHGAWGAEAHHSGDIGNIEVGEDGAGSISLTTDMWSIGGDDPDKNILGKGIIVHAGADDFTTQPTGAAGGRIACGVIVAKSE